MGGRLGAPTAGSGGARAQSKAKPHARPHMQSQLGSLHRSATWPLAAHSYWPETALLLWRAFQGEGQPSRPSHVRRTPRNRGPAAPTLPRRQEDSGVSSSGLHPPSRSMEVLATPPPPDSQAPHVPPQPVGAAAQSRASVLHSLQLYGPAQYCHPHHIKKQVQRASLLTIFPFAVPSACNTLPQLPSQPTFTHCRSPLRYPLREPFPEHLPCYLPPGAHPSRGTQASSCMCFLSLFSNESSQGGT